MKKLKLIKKITTLSLINIGTLISLPLIASSCSHSQEEAEQITIRGSHNLNIRDGSDGTTNYFFNDNKNKLMTISWNNQPAWLTLEQDKEHNHIKVKWTSAPAGFNDQHFNFHVISETGKEETFFIFLHAIEVISFVSTTQTKFSITHTFAPGPFDDYYQFVANSTRPANTITYALSEHVGYFYMANNGWLGHNNPTMGESFTQFAYVIATSSTGVSCKIQCEFKIYSTE